MSRTNKPSGVVNAEAITAYLRGIPGICAAFLHGSAAKGNMRGDSDIDLALLLFPGTSLPVEKRLAIAVDLEDLLGRRVDVGVLSTRNPVFAKEAVCGGRLLFSHDRAGSDLFAATVLAMYAKLQEDRKEVLHAYAA